MFGIMRIEKRQRQALHGIEAENNRTAERPLSFVCSDINWESTNANYYFAKCDNFRKSIETKLYDLGISTRSNSVYALDSIYTASAEFFEDKNNEEIYQFFKDCYNFHAKRFGHVLNAVVHLDESTPHMHLISIPITQDGRLSARDVMGNKKDYHAHQEAFFQDVGRDWGLERGEVGSPARKRKHLKTLEYKISESKKQLQELDEIYAIGFEQYDKLRNKYNGLLNACKELRNARKQAQEIDERTKSKAFDDCER